MSRIIDVIISLTMSRVNKLQVVIIGGGFGGTVTAKYLKPLIMSGKIDVTIINRGYYFVFHPLLHEVATGALYPDTVLEPIKDIFKHSNVNLVRDLATGIDPIKKVVSLSNGSISYDYLVISSGAETNYYGVVGAKENTITLKDLDDAVRIKRVLIEASKSCAVIGAGATGVELAAEIVEFRKSMEVCLVAASPDVLPNFPVELRKIAYDRLVKKGIKVMTGETVVEVKQENNMKKIIFVDKSFIEAEVVIWVAGVKPSVIEVPGAEKEKSGRIKIDEFLKVEGVRDIFSLGDVSGTSPMLAQVAVQQGKIAAKNIISTICRKPLVPFKFKEKGLLISLGQWHAAGQLFGVSMKGPFMWWVWRTVYLFNFHSWKKRLKIAFEWTIDIFWPRRY
ncbi:MAG: NAD(P)/FAD-dependent oxidoreductase [bacterium]|nr:NAD(P)/FAD-dependent oxidoreductase [bacterium]